jgi:nitrate reductase NapE
LTVNLSLSLFNPTPWKAESWAIYRPNIIYYFGILMSDNHNEPEVHNKASEWKTFLVLTVCLFPALSVALIGAYGFGIWFLQMFLMGPPGH